jgi:hypothetical protein
MDRRTTTMLMLTEPLKGSIIGVGIDRSNQKNHVNTDCVCVLASHTEKNQQRNLPKSPKPENPFVGKPGPDGWVQWVGPSALA